MTTHTELLERITVRADVFGGKPIIRDMRIPVEHVPGMLAAGDSAETILQEYPVLEPEDIQACLLFSHRAASVEFDRCSDCKRLGDSMRSDSGTLDTSPRATSGV